jgi:uncharacterized protein
MSWKVPWIAPPAMDSSRAQITTDMNTAESQPRQVVHLELHTAGRATASTFYARLLGWRSERIATQSGCYFALDLGKGLGGGIVECGARQPLWLPYVEVDQVDASTAHARQLGALVLLEPREGPAGWRSVVSTPEGGEIAFWQPKR